MTTGGCCAVPTATELPVLAMSSTRRQLFLSLNRNLNDSGGTDEVSGLGDSGRGDCPWPALAAAAGCLLTLAIILFVLPAATYTAKVPNDIFAFFDAMHRMHMGQSPHVDFRTPFGWLTHGLPYLGYLAFGQFGGALEFGSAAMLAILLPLAAVALHGRAPTGPSLLLLAALFAIVTVPWPLGESGFVSTQVAYHNRWGWALLTALLLFGLPAAGRDGKGQIAIWRRLDAAAIAALLSMLFFVKATYFAVGLVFVLLFGVALGRFRRTGAWGLTVFLLVVLGVQAVGGWVDDYMRDLLRTLEIGVEPGVVARDGPPDASSVLHATLGWLGLAAMACAIAGLNKRLPAQDMLLAAYVLTSCTALATQNTSYPDVLFALLALFIWMAALCPRGSVHRRLIMAAMWVFLLPMFSRQLLATAVFLMAAHGACPGCASGLPRMEGAWFGGLGSANAFDAGVLQMPSPQDALLWSRRNPLHSHMDLSNAEYLHTLQTGLALLKAAGYGNGPVATVDYVNPFPVLLDVPSPRGALLFLHVGRHFNRRTAANPDLIFGDANWLMIPKFPIAHETTALILEVQAAHLDAGWEQAAVNEHWRLLRRSNEPPRSE